jgi:hypothetical protein
VNVSWTADRPEATEADTVVVGVFEDEEPRTDAGGRVPDPVGELLASGEAQRSFKSLALTHADGKSICTSPRRRAASGGAPSPSTWTI